jgi:hypothetical protein
VATKVYLIPEVGFVQVPDGGSREYLIPEGGFFSEGAESTTVNVSATCASLILTDNNATVTVESNISASCAALLLSTLAASITGAINVPATCAALTLTTLPATVDGSSVILVDALTAAMILTSNPAVVSLPVNIAATCAVALLRTKYADVSVESHAVIETGWQKDRGLGPWEFNKPPKKYGYINNPRFVNKDEATEIHKPCGYWPLVYSEIGWYQQMVAVDSSRKLIGASMISQDNAQYKLMYYNYETDSIIKEVDFSTEGVLLNTYYGATLLFDKADGEPRILYLNYEDTNLCSYAYDYNGRMTNLVIDTAVSVDYRTQGVYLGSGMIVVANMKDSNSYSYTSDDYGNSWSSGTLIVAGSPVTFCYDGASRIYAAYTVFDDSQPFRVKYSTNAGSTWISMDGLPDSPEAYATGVLFAASGSNLLAV